MVGDGGVHVRGGGTNVKVRDRQERRPEKQKTGWKGNLVRRAGTNGSRGQKAKKGGTKKDRDNEYALAREKTKGTGALGTQGNHEKVGESDQKGVVVRNPCGTVGRGWDPTTGT